MSRGRLTPVLLVCAVLTTIMACSGLRTDGPIARSGAVGLEVPPRGAMPVTFGLPISPTAGPVTLRTVALINVTGLEVVGVMACEGSPWSGDSYLNCAPTGGAWPPANVSMQAVDGTVIGSSPEENGGLLVGARLASGTSSGSIDGVRIVYAYAGVEYQVDEPWTLAITSQ